MDLKFEILFLEEALQFLRSLDEKASSKILYNIEKARVSNDPKLFKKLTTEIWEFRTKYGGLQYRLLAFWDKTEKVKTLVISTHGFVKKVDKVSVSEIDKAKTLRNIYFIQKKR